MKITAIKAQAKDANRVSVYLDGSYAFSLTLDQLIEERLAKGSDIDEQRKVELQKKSQNEKLYMQTLYWIASRPHSEFEVRAYLRKKKLEPDECDALVERLKLGRHVDDERFVRWFTEQRMRKNKSNRQIIAELRAKGVDPAAVEPLLRTAEHESDYDRMHNLAKKKMSLPRYKEPMALTRYLISKGFTYDDVKRVVNSLFP